MNETVWKLPVPASALIRGPTFVALGKRRCELSFSVEGEQGETQAVGLRFEGVEAYKCTYLTSCSAQIFNTAYGKLVRLESTQWLNKILMNYKASPKSNELQHLMICFDDGPCYEIICVSFGTM